MNSAKSEIAIAVPLKLWQNPQGNILLRYSREECLIYFGCWTEAGQPADYLGQLTFQQTWAVRGLRLEWHPYKINEPIYRSCLLMIENSLWLEQVTAQRLKHYPNWRTWDCSQYLHYVVMGHDNYYEIIASGFDEQRLPENEAGELITLIDEA